MTRESLQAEIDKLGIEIVQKTRRICLVIDSRRKDQSELLERLIETIDLLKAMKQSKLKLLEKMK